MKDILHWLLIGAVVVAVLVFVVWLLSIAWDFFLVIGLIAVFAITCSWYFNSKYGE